jgi:hypothetical protein
LLVGAGMRAICLIALMLAACGSDSDVMDMAAPDLDDGRAEFCGGVGRPRCCTNERVGEPCTDGDSCRYDELCPPGYLGCQAGIWVHMGIESCDMARAPAD